MNQKKPATNVLRVKKLSRHTCLHRKDNADLADAAPRTPKTGVRRILRMLSTHKQEIRLGRTV